MTPLDLSTLRRFVELAGERLTGDWVILGGSVVPLLGGTQRATADIDVAGPDDAAMDQVVVLLKIAVELGLPAETVNQAGAFFLREIDGWRDDLEVLHRGPGATIHTPNPTLFVLTKIGRLTDSDLGDCQSMLRLARARGESIDGDRLTAAVDAALDTQPSTGRRERLVALRASLSPPRG